MLVYIVGILAQVLRCRRARALAGRADVGSVASASRPAAACAGVPCPAALASGFCGGRGCTCVTREREELQEREVESGVSTFFSSKLLVVNHTQATKKKREEIGKKKTYRDSYYEIIFSF